MITHWSLWCLWCLLWWCSSGHNSSITCVVVVVVVVVQKRQQALIHILVDVYSASTDISEAPGGTTYVYFLLFSSTHDQPHKHEQCIPYLPPILSITFPAAAPHRNTALGHPIPVIKPPLILPTLCTVPLWRYTAVVTARMSNCICGLLWGRHWWEMFITWPCGISRKPTNNQIYYLQKLVGFPITIKHSKLQMSWNDCTTALEKL